MNLSLCFVVLDNEFQKTEFLANDSECGTSCAGGGWWMDGCDLSACLNGLYFHDDYTDAQADGMSNGIFYKSFHDKYYSLKKTTMMMREAIEWPKT